MSTEDRVRSHPVCPLCYGVKDVGLLVCWGCYRRTDMRKWGLLDENAERQIRAFGERLAEVNP